MQCDVCAVTERRKGLMYGKCFEPAMLETFVVRNVQHHIEKRGGRKETDCMKDSDTVKNVN